MASDHRNELSVAADACQIGKVGGWRASALERGEALIRFEGLSELDDAGHVLAAVGEFIVLQTVMEARMSGQRNEQKASTDKGC